MNPQRSLTSSEYQNQLACFPYGVGRETEGVCLLVQMGPHRILLDCGLEDIQPLQEESLPPVEVVLCSHAHADHAQGLLALHEAFPQIPIYASEVTTKLLPLNWQENKLHPIEQFCKPLKWRSPFELSQDLSVELFPAGHMPGAASLLLTYKFDRRSYKLFYTGDFSVSNFQLVEGLSIEGLRGLAPDVLIIEGSYGTARHPHRRQQEKQLMERLDRAISAKQNVLLPVPPLGLGQEILKLLRSHHQFTGRDIDIWVDGKIADACDVYLDLLSQFPASVQNFAKHQALFWDEKVCPRLRQFPPQETFALDRFPCIVVTDRIADLAKYCSPESGSWLILLPEHPRLHLSPDCPQLSELASFPEIAIQTYLLAEHSDGRNTTQLIHNLRPQHVIFVHGSSNYLADLTSLEELQNRYQLHSPAAGTLVELPIGEKFIQPAVPAPTSYEGELNESGTAITISLPDSLKEDPRWQNFGDTGLVEARWQGEEILIRGLSQRELLSQSNNARIPTDIDCCGNCRYQRSQRCWNSASPLYGFKVTPDGYCPVFEPIERKED